MDTVQTLHTAANGKDLNVYKPSKKQNPLYWFLESYFGFPIMEKLQVALFSITWCCSCRLFLINFSFLQEKVFPGSTKCQCKSVSFTFQHQTRIYS